MLRGGQLKRVKNVNYLEKMGGMMKKLVNEAERLAHLWGVLEA